MKDAVTHRARERGGGFTLVEVLTVVAIIGILAAILIPTVSGVRDSAKRAETKVRFSQWAAALESFRQEYGYYPAIANDHLLDPTKFLAALTGRSHLGDPLAGAALNGNTKGVAFHALNESEFVRDAAGGARNEIIDAFGNSEIVVLVDADGDGVIRGAERVVRAVRRGNSVDGWGEVLTPEAEAVPAAGIRAGVVFYSAGRGAAPADVVFSWR